METLNHCPSCYSPGPFDEEFRVRDHYGSGEFFGIQRCSCCGLLFTNPRPQPSEMGVYYKSGMYISHTDKAKGFTGRLYHWVKQEMLRSKLRMLKNHTVGEGLRLLDYGCGTGSFALAAKNAGFAVFGYEPDPAAAELGRKKGIDVFEREGEAIGAKARFDVISLWHVLEHLHRFPGIIDDFREALSDRGLLLIALPMADSADARHYREYWAAWDVPRHLVHFTPATIENKLSDHGFRLEKRYPLVFDSFYVSLLSEKYQGRSLPHLRAFFLGFWSNYRAKTGKSSWSSEVFVFRKVEGRK